MKQIILLIAAITFSLSGWATTISSTATGEWDGLAGAGSATGPWSGGVNPQSGDTVIINAGHTISLTGQDYAYGYMHIIINGIMRFNNCELAFGDNTSSIFIAAGGRIESVTASMNDRIEIGPFGTDWGGTFTPVLGPKQIVDNSILPITLLYFRAYEEGKDVRLQWAAADESEILAYKLLRSADGENFTELSGPITPFGTDNRATYSFLDKQPLVGTSYYRLVAINEDNSTEIFDAVAVFVASRAPSVQVFPNPVRNSDLYINLQFKEPSNIKIFDMFGRNILEQVGHYGLNPINLTPLVTQGYYLVFVQNGEERFNFKILVDK